MSRSELNSLKNIGATSAAWLEAVGIHTREDLERMALSRPSGCCAKAVPVYR